MSKNLVIGMDGKIPWRIPRDRALFKELTRDRILIVGRKTFEEAPNQRHIDHARYCIVISRSLETLVEDIDGVDRLQLARSFKEALDQAKQLSKNLPEQVRADEKRDLLCWVAGGENIYEEAIRHPSSKELHLSTIDLEFDIRRGVVRFPAKHRWDNKYEMISSESFDQELEPNTPGFSYSIWKRKTRGGR
jgi:dihydrofolate reductase